MSSAKSPETLALSARCSFPHRTLQVRGLCVAERRISADTLRWDGVLVVSIRSCPMIESDGTNEATPSLNGLNPRPKS